MNSKNILIIGNLGYVGCVLNQFLFERNYSVYGIDTNWFATERQLKQQSLFTTDQKILDIRKIYQFCC